MEFSLPPIEVLHKLRVERPEVFEQTEVFVDGGVRRGTDILKALCLGARAVGLGRPFLYANGTYGEPGVIKVLRILEREMTTGMKLLGASSLDQLAFEMIDYLDEAYLARL